MLTGFAPDDQPDLGRSGVAGGHRGATIGLQLRRRLPAAVARGGPYTFGAGKGSRTGSSGAPTRWCRLTRTAGCRSGFATLSPICSTVGALLATPEPLFQATLLRNQWFADSPLEERGFELSVPLRGCNSSRPPPFDLSAPHLSVKETDVL
jgi:hypothetical protein